MSTQITEEVRDPNSGVLTAIRVVTFDDYGRKYFADVPVSPTGSVVVGVDVSTVVAAVQEQVRQIVAAKSAGPGQVLQPSDVISIARGKGSKR